MIIDFKVEKQTVINATDSNIGDVLYKVTVITDRPKISYFGFFNNATDEQLAGAMRNLADEIEGK